MMRRLSEVDGLRGILALWVVVGHFGASLPKVHSSLYAGTAVEIFIIISGFAITFLLDQNGETYGRYVIRRILRLFPVYLVVLFISTLTLDFARSVLLAAPTGEATGWRIHLIETAQENLPAHVAAHTLLIQGLIPTSVLPYSPFTLVGQAWSLSLEWQFYLLAPLLFRLLVNLHQSQRIFCLFSIVSIGLLAGRYFGAEFLGNSLSLFGVGFSSYLLYAGKFTRPPLVPLWIAVVASLTAAFLSFTAATTIWLAVFVCLIVDDIKFRVNPIRRLLSTSAATYLGRISYPLFLSHMQVLFVIIWLANMLDMSISERLVLLLLIGLPLAIAVADVLHRVIEAPCQQYGRRIALDGTHPRSTV